MKTLYSAIAGLFLTASLFAQNTQYVNPFVGTAGFGNVYPGAQVPFGGIQISPDTDDYDYDVAAGYKYTKPTIMGFSLTHLSGTGIPDLGDFMFVPGKGESTFSHDTEAACEATAASATAAITSSFFICLFSFFLLSARHTMHRTKFVKGQTEV